MIELMHSDFARLPGSPETALRPDDLASLPEVAPPAPWRVVARTLFWSARPDAAARAAIDAVVPAELREGAVPVATVGGLLRYQETPVGGYAEVIGIVLFRRGRSLFTHVPFIADTWQVRAQAGPAGVPLPVITPSLPPVVQLGPHGRRYTVRAGGSWSRALTAQARIRGVSWPARRSAGSTAARSRRTSHPSPTTKQPCPPSSSAPCVPARRHRTAFSGTALRTTQNTCALASTNSTTISANNPRAIQVMRASTGSPVERRPSRLRSAMVATSSSRAGPV